MLLTNKVRRAQEPTSTRGESVLTICFLDTWSAVAQICAIFDIPMTIGPEATVSVSTSNPLLTTLAIPTQSSLPPISTTPGPDPAATTPSSYVPASGSEAGSSTSASQSSTTTSHPASQGGSGSAATSAAVSTASTNGCTRSNAPSRITSTLVLSLTTIIILLLTRNNV